MQLNSLRLMSFLVVPALVLLLGGGPGFADMVRVTGRAALVDRNTDHAQRLALEDALYLAALQGGADVSGFSMADKGVLAGESVLLRPNSRILDYSVVSEGPSGSYYEVVIDAYVGASPEIDCTARPAIQLVSGRPQIHVAHTAPVWAKDALESAHEATVARLQSTPQIQISARDISLVRIGQSDSNVPSGFDYKVLMGRQAQVPAPASSKIPDAARGLHLSWEAAAPGLHAATMTVTLRAQIIDPASPRRNQQLSISQKLAVSANTPWRTINVLARKDANDISNQLADNVVAELAEWLGAYACAPLQAYLTAAGEGRFRIDLGSRDGLTYQSLAFAEGRGQPWTVFRIVELTPSHATLSPLNGKRPSARLTGATVSFDLGG